MYTITLKDSLISWLKKHGWPDKHKSSSFMFAISPDTGRAPEGAYCEWDGSFEGLPKDIKLIFKRKDLKTYTWVYLDSVNGRSEDKGKDPEKYSLENALVPPEIAQEKRALFELKCTLEKREESLRAWENDMREMEFDIKKSQAATVRIGGELDTRVSNVMSRLKEYEEHLDRRKKNDEKYIRELTDTLGELAEIKEQHKIYGHVVYTIEKIAAAMSIRGIKNMSDEELKKLPPGFMDDFAKFMADKAERHLFQSVPDSHRIVGEAFMRLPDNDNKYEFCRVVIGWTVEHNPKLINEIAKEYQERKNVA